MSAAGESQARASGLLHEYGFEEKGIAQILPHLRGRRVPAEGQLDDDLAPPKRGREK